MKNLSSYVFLTSSWERHREFSQRAADNAEQFEDKSLLAERETPLQSMVKMSWIYKDLMRLLQLSCCQWIPVNSLNRRRHIINQAYTFISTE